jgi:hypothetical protein
MLKHRNAAGASTPMPWALGAQGDGPEAPAVGAPPAADAPPHGARFRALIGRAPTPADRSGGGTLPARAVRYCEAVTAAAAFGWHLFPPSTVELLWDGREVRWRLSEWGFAESEWLPLRSAAQYPGFAARFDAACPPELRGLAPPFLAALPEPGVVQVWTGALARTSPGWSLLLRAPANLPGRGGYEHFEGVVDTDTWQGPLFVNLRLLRTGEPIVLDADWPLIQAQPIPRAALGARRVEDAGAPPRPAGPETLDPDDWAGLGTALLGAAAVGSSRRPLGAAAAATRRLRRQPGACPVTGAAGAGVR